MGWFTLIPSDTHLVGVLGREWHGAGVRPDGQALGPEAGRVEERVGTEAVGGDGQANGNPNTRVVASVVAVEGSRRVAAARRMTGGLWRRPGSQ